MRRSPLLTLAVQAALVAGLAVALWADKMPLGVPGEWVWSTTAVLPDATPSAPGIATALMGVAIYAAFAALGRRALAGGAGRSAEGAWLAGLLAGAVAVQSAVIVGAPTGLDFSRWAALADRGSSGYYTLAARIGDPWAFWADYPRWIRKQDALHIGTHPPGLFLASYASRRAMTEWPGAARVVDGVLPESARRGFRILTDGQPRVDRAAMGLIAVGTLLACCGTVVPLYLLVRLDRPAEEAWSAAALWPVVPTAALFHPIADTAFPLLSTGALACAAWAARGRPALALGAGLLLGVGMFFTLAYLPVGLIVALVVLTAPRASWGDKVSALVVTGIGFLAVTLASWAVSGADPFAIWWWNLKNHSRFYEEYPRTYLAWVIVNPIETAIAFGLPASVWLAVGLTDRRLPRVVWATLGVLVLLNLSGRNLSETARLWLPFLPPLLAGASAGMSRLGGGPLTLAATIVLMALEALTLQMEVQVAFPVSD
jgi:methylthioxylose transferase